MKIYLVVLIFLLISIQPAHSQVIFHSKNDSCFEFNKYYYAPNDLKKGILLTSKNLFIDSFELVYIAKNGDVATYHFRSNHIDSNNNVLKGLKNEDKIIIENIYCHNSNQNQILQPFSIYIQNSSYISNALYDYYSEMIYQLKSPPKNQYIYIRNSSLDQKLIKKIEKRKIDWFPFYDLGHLDNFQLTQIQNSIFFKPDDYSNIYIIKYIYSTEENIKNYVTIKVEIPHFDKKLRIHDVSFIKKEESCLK